jgi:hypothetical protein
MSKRKIWMKKKDAPAVFCCGKRVLHLALADMMVAGRGVLAAKKTLVARAHSKDVAREPFLADSPQ